METITLITVIVGVLAVILSIFQLSSQVKTELQGFRAEMNEFKADIRAEISDLKENNKTLTARIERINSDLSLRIDKINDRIDVLINSIYHKKAG